MSRVSTENWKGQALSVALKALSASCPGPGSSDSTAREMGLPKLAVVSLALGLVMVSAGKYWNPSCLGSLAQPFGGCRGGDRLSVGLRASQIPTRQTLLCNLTAPFQSSAHKPYSSPATPCFSALPYGFWVSWKASGVWANSIRNILKLVAFYLSTLVSPFSSWSGKRRE